jgi:cation diffusion facilitator family transporter
MGTSRLQRSVRVTLIGFAVNVLLAVSKLIAGVLGHSHALVADSIESFGDLLSSLIVWRGLVVAATPADEDHPYGHGKAEPIAAALVATLLLVAALGIFIKSALAIATPALAPRPFTLVVLLLVVVIKETLFRFVAREGILSESVALGSDAWHHRSDAITSLCAAIGIGVAIVGGEAFQVADPIAAMAAGGIIAWNGSFLLRSALSELMDATPSADVRGKVRQVAQGVPGVEGIETCVVRKMGYHYYVDMHVEVDPALTVQEAHDIAHLVKDRVREEIPAVYDVLIHIEPAW